MNVPVDVLAVLQRQIDLALSYGNDERAEALQDTRAAIAVLIDKAETAEQALRNLVAAGAHPNWANYADDLRAALARAGGGK